jgi:uncharacterized protein YjlB
MQRWGGPIEEFKQGDVIWIPAGVKHWHGAAPHAAMAHIAISLQQHFHVSQDQAKNRQDRSTAHGFCCRTLQSSIKSREINQ